MKSKVNELLEHVSKIENGSVTLPELEYSVELARDLYEKLVVVRHKVYEQGILEQPTFDLSPIAFEEETPDISEPETIEIQENNTETSMFEFENNVEETSELERNDILVEEPTLENEMDVKEDSMGFSEEVIFDANETELTDYSDDLEKPMQEVLHTEAPSQIGVDSGSWVHKLKEIESHIPASFTMSKLDTLIGSFGLNERLQFINELFGGSSESFSDAVKVLDARTGMESAREKIAEFAASNSWEDADNETITDFVAKIKRRYA